MKKSKGFTLLEILLALFIFTLLTTIAFSALHNLLNTRERLNHDFAQLSQLQITSLLLRRDLQTIIDRPVLTENGITLPAFEGESTAITFTHTSFVNPLSLMKRSTLQRINYQLKNFKLIKTTWPVLDRTPYTKPITQEMLNNVLSLQFYYLDQKGQFFSIWPPNNIPADQQADNKFPKAINIELELKNRGTVNFLIPISAASLTKV